MSDKPDTAQQQSPVLSGKEAAALDKLVLRHLGPGQPGDRAQRLELLLAQADAPSELYEQWLRCGTRIYQQLAEKQTPGAAGTAVRAALLYVYLGQLERARALLPASCGVECAYVRLWEAEAARPRPVEGAKGAAQAAPPGGASGAGTAPLPDAVARLYVQAGEALLAAQRPVQAALAYQAAGNLAQAQACWQKVLADSRLLPYQQALVRVNLSLALHRAGSATEREAHRQAATAQQLLEEVADEAEASGERERALDCYRVLLQLGQELGRFENLAEGYLNSIRILKDEQLRLHALRYYEDFARVGAKLGEYHTVAQICREAADYLDRRGLDQGLRRQYQRRAAVAAMAAAAQLQERGGAATLGEQAYLLAIESWNALDDFAKVRNCFVALAALPLPAERQQRYRRLVDNYPQATAGAAVPDDPLPAFLRQPQAYPPVWILDLLEWEAAGDPAAVCLTLLGDTERATVTRRHALLVLLLAYGQRHRPVGAEPEPPAQLAILSGLMNLRAYEALRPLERLYAEATPRPGTPDGAATQRAAILEALPKLLFKRSFYLVLRGLDDPDATVRRQALQSLARLHFPDAIAPLCRLYRDRSDPLVRSAVLASLGRAHDLRAGEFLLEVLRHEAEPLRSQARQLLLRYDNQELVPLIRRSLELDSGPARPGLAAVLAHLTGENAAAAD